MGRNKDGGKREISIPFSTFADKADRQKGEGQTDEPLNPPHF